MQIEMSKSELAEALRALGKLVCRTSPVEVYQSLQIEGEESRISFQAVGLDEAITYTIPVKGVDDFVTVVNFDCWHHIACLAFCFALYRKSTKLCLKY